MSDVECVRAGFAAAATVLCTFPQDVLADLAQEVLDFISYRAGSIDTHSVLLVRVFSDGGFSVNAPARGP